MTFQFSTFTRHVMTLTSGTAVAQLIGVLCAPILTRLYTPYEFGLFAIVSGIISILTIIICGRYELTIVLPENRQDAIQLSFLSIIITIFISTLVLVISLIYSSEIGYLLNTPEIENLLWLVPIALLGAGIYQTLNFFLTRDKRFKSIAISRIIFRAFTISTQIGIVMLFAGIGAFGLIIGTVIGQWVATISLIYVLLANKDIRNKISSFDKSGIKKTALRFSNFPKHLMFSHLLNGITFQIPIFFIPQSSTQLLGHFGLIIRLMDVPIGLLGASIGQVFFTEAARQKKTTGSCFNIYKRTFKKLILISPVIFLPLLLIGDEIYVFIFGNDWTGMSVVVKYMIPVFLLRFIAQPISSVFFVNERTDIDLYFRIGLITCSICSMLIAKNLGGGLAYIYCYSILMSLAYIINIIMSYQIAKSN